MQSSAIKGAAAVAAIAAVFALFFVLRDADNAEEPNPSITPASPGEQEPRAGKPQDERPPLESSVLPTITVRDGEPVGGVQELSFHSGTPMRFAVESDVADELHLHGYDVSQPIKAGGRVEFDQKADIEGVFELELEDRGVPVAEISVTP